MATIKCRRCGKTIATSKRAAWSLATEYVNDTWQHNAPCKPSATPLWTKGQQVTIERLFSGAERYVMCASEIRTVARVTSSRIILDDGSTWQLDGKSPSGYRADGHGKVRPEVPGDAEVVERRTLISKIVSIRGDVWSDLSLATLRDLGKAIDEIEAGRAALAKGEPS